jgi:hypothetical protein
MDYSLLTYFAQGVIQRPGEDEPPNPNGFGRNTSGFTFGISDGLIELIHQVSSLHTRSCRSPGLTSTIISESVGLWQKLDRWQPRCPPPSNNPEYIHLYQSYNSALFIWLHLVVHPDNIHDDKVQTVVRTGLEEIAAVTTTELLPLLQIPVFVHGLASLQAQDRNRISREFERIRSSGRSVELSAYQSVVHRCWSAQDRGTRRSWDWTR